MCIDEMIEERDKHVSTNFRCKYFQIDSPICYFSALMKQRVGFANKLLRWAADLLVKRFGSPSLFHFVICFFFLQCVGGNFHNPI